MDGAALMALFRSVPWQLPATQSRAAEEMAAMLLHWQARSVATVQPTVVAAALMQLDAQDGNSVVRLSHWDWARARPTTAARLRAPREVLMVAAETSGWRSQVFA